MSVHLPSALLVLDRLTCQPPRCASLLLHSETASGSVVPVWEDAEEASVASVREIMEDAGESAKDLDLLFKRLPMTSERPPDSNDLRELMRLVITTDWETTVVVLNDQLGRGRVRTRYSTCLGCSSLTRSAIFLLL